MFEVEVHISKQNEESLLDKQTLTITHYTRIECLVLDKQTLTITHYTRIECLVLDKQTLTITHYARIECLVLDKQTIVSVCLSSTKHSIRV
jgi:uncharacterized cysteine cluster protein YcgN (CxxCxxCC family)